MPPTAWEVLEEGCIADFALLGVAEVWCEMLLLELDFCCRWCWWCCLARLCLTVLCDVTVGTPTGSFKFWCEGGGLTFSGVSSSSMLIGSRMPLSSSVCIISARRAEERVDSSMSEFDTSMMGSIVQQCEGGGVQLLRQLLEK